MPKPNPMPHSVLTAQLVTIRNNIDQLITLTAGGVIEEGGELPVTDAPKEYDSGFVFGPKSQSELIGVYPTLFTVTCLALKLSTQDFMIHDGKRTIDEQRKHVANGTSQTMHSKHLPQADGFAHAVDAVPVNESGQPVWDWKMIYPVAVAFVKAATQLKCADKIRWGGAWDRRLSDFITLDEGGIEAQVKAYCERHAGKDFIDGPHFEWVG